MSAGFGAMPVLPRVAQAASQAATGPLEKTQLNIGFIPISCATPLILADALGLYRQEGLDVRLVKSAGWAIVRDQLVNGELDAAHMLAPMPLAMSLGIGSAPQPVRIASMQNVNGNSIVLGLPHRARRDPRDWRGMKFAIPFEFSMHNLLLRQYLAGNGIDPDRDVQLRVTPPPEMLANLRAGNIDGFIAPDSLAQRAVIDEIGFIHLLTSELWPGHPCCAFGLTQAFIDRHPNTFAALNRAILKGLVAARDPKNRADIVARLSAPAYLNQPELVLMQVLTGRFADGLGHVRRVPDRIDFQPLPWPRAGAWMLSQLQRWNYLKQDVDPLASASTVLMLDEARNRMREAGLAVPQREPDIVVMGTPYRPEIRRS